MRVVTRYGDSWWVTTYDAEGRMVMFRPATEAEVPSVEAHPEFRPTA